MSLPSRTTRSVVVALGVLAASLLVAASASAWTVTLTNKPPKVQLSFANLDPNANPGEPQFDARDDEINRHIVSLIDGTPSGETIHGGIYDIGANSGVVQALQRAHWRNVTLRIVQNVADSENLRLGLPPTGTTDPAKGLGTGSVHRCARDVTQSPSVTGDSTGQRYSKSQCNGYDPGVPVTDQARRGEMHSKYWLFSKTGQTNFVTVYTSQNPVDGAGGAAAFNNAVTVFNDDRLYTHTKNRIVTPMWNWNTTYDGASMSPNPWWGTDFLDVDGRDPQNSAVVHPRGYFYSSSNNAGEWATDGADITVYASPEASGDTLAARLSGITDANTATPALDPDPTCKVRVMQNMIHRRNQGTDGVYRDGVRELVRLKQTMKCAVSVLVSSEVTDANPAGRAAARIDQSAACALKGAGIPIRVSQARLHDKVVLLDANYENKADSRFNVITGSHNITHDALRRNDELLVRLSKNQPAHDQFVQHFNSAWNALGAWDYVPVC